MSLTQQQSIQLRDIAAGDDMALAEAISALMQVPPVTISAAAVSSVLPNAFLWEADPITLSGSFQTLTAGWSSLTAGQQAQRARTSTFGAINGINVNPATFNFTQTGLYRCTITQQNWTASSSANVTIGVGFSGGNSLNFSPFGGNAATVQETIAVISGSGYAFQASKMFRVTDLVQPFLQPQVCGQSGVPCGVSVLIELLAVP